MIHQYTYFDIDRAFVKEYASLRIKLPEITRLKIDYLSKCKEVKVFLEYCFPFKMRFFTFNSESYEVLNMEDYIDSMTGLLGCVTKEVFLLMTHMNNSYTINIMWRLDQKIKIICCSYNIPLLGWGVYKSEKIGKFFPKVYPLTPVIIFVKNGFKKLFN